MPSLAPSHTSSRDSQVRLHVVTGKGGTGKTTVSAALALSLAREGRRVLVAEVEGRGGLGPVLGTADDTKGDEPLVRGLPGGGSVHLLEVDPRAALHEYLRSKVPVAPAAGVLARIGAVDLATTIAPGVRDVLVLGKVYEAVGRARRGGVRSPVYDAVVLDAPPTGRVGRFLGAPAEIASLAQVGPVRRQADSITRLLQGPGTRVHVVTLLEDMPVQESVEAVADLRDRSLRVGHLLVNRERPRVLTPETEAAASAPGSARRLRQTLETAGLDLTTDVVDRLLAQARDEGASQGTRDRLRGPLGETGVPVLPLRLLPGGVTPRSLERLADDLEGLR